MQTIQLILVVLLGFIVSAVLTGVEIPILKKKQFKQFIREEGLSPICRNRARQPWADLPFTRRFLR